MGTKKVIQALRTTRVKKLLSKHERAGGMPCTVEGMAYVQCLATHDEKDRLVKCNSTLMQLRECTKSMETRHSRKMGKSAKTQILKTIMKQGNKRL